MMKLLEKKGPWGWANISLFFFSTLSFHKSFTKGLRVRHKPKTKFGSQFNTNNAREYFYSVQSEYLFKHGIIQISSCVNTPQQNGVDERKIRHLTEVTQSLMFSIGVPKYLWGGSHYYFCISHQ